MIAALAKADFVDHEAPQAEWRLVHRVADAAMGRVAAVVARALEAAVVTQRVAERLRQDPDGAVAGVALEPMAAALMQLVWPPLEAVYRRAGDIVTRNLGRHPMQKARLGTKTRPRLGFGFDITNPSAQEWAEQQSARLVRDVTDETRDAIRGIVGDAFRNQLPPVKLAAQLRQVIGLNRRQMDALSRKRDRWVADGLPPTQIQRLVQREHQTALRYRSMNIARTEVMNASNSGQLEAWRQARSAGLLSPKLVKQFVVTPDDRLCPVCAPLDGEQRELDRAFSFGGQNPPVHPSCRCAVGMALPKTRELTDADILSRGAADYPIANTSGTDTLARHTGPDGLTPERR